MNSFKMGIKLFLINNEKMFKWDCFWNQKVCKWVYFIYINYYVDYNCNYVFIIKIWKNQLLMFFIYYDCFIKDLWFYD